MGDARDTAKKKKADEKKSNKGSKAPADEARRGSKTGGQVHQEVRLIKSRSA